MNLLFSIATLGILSVLTLQDFKHRAISWFLIPLLLLSFLIPGMQKLGFHEFATYTGINLGLLIVNMLGVAAFIALKEKKPVNIIDTYIGLGDLLFFVVLTTAFSPLNFLAFYIGSITLCCLAYIVLRLAVKQTTPYFPLAGAMSLLLGGLMIARIWFPEIHFYTDFIFWI
ncbi:MAG: hypothetical protein KDD41_03960 [Flavobacteriales bacterium]|nr:hypothetical protein [Flavobacteriales bacterium]